MTLSNCMDTKTYEFKEKLSIDSFSLFTFTFLFEEKKASWKVKLNYNRVSTFY